MSSSAVGLVWRSMRLGELYSAQDLGNKLDQPVELVGRVLEFLAKYSFVEPVTERELIFRKSVRMPGPGGAFMVLQTIAENAREQGQAAGVSGLLKDVKLSLD